MNHNCGENMLIEALLRVGYVNLCLSMKFAILRRHRLATEDLIVEFVSLCRLNLATKDLLFHGLYLRAILGSRVCILDL